MRIIEVCCESVADALEAKAGGASRIELCTALDLGGLTPSYGMIIQTVARCQPPAVRVLIRPRGGNFVYTSDEIDIMVRDIRICRDLGVQGVVWGALKADGSIDVEACQRLMHASEGLSVTFHRAFDVCRDPMTALETIIHLGCDHLLTSGQAATAEAGAERLARLVQEAGERIIIMAGVGITPQNIAKIERLTGAVEFHSTAHRSVETTPVYTNPEVSFDENLPRPATCRDVVARLIND